MTSSTGARLTLVCPSSTSWKGTVHTSKSNNAVHANVSIGTGERDETGRSSSSSRQRVCRPSSSRDPPAPGMTRTDATYGFRSTVLITRRQSQHGPQSEIFRGEASGGQSLAGLHQHQERRGSNRSKAEWELRGAEKEGHRIDQQGCRQVGTRWALPEPLQKGAARDGHAQ